MRKLGYVVVINSVLSAVNVFSAEISADKSNALFLRASAGLRSHCAQHKGLVARGQKKKSDVANLLRQKRGTLNVFENPDSVRLAVFDPDQGSICLLKKPSGKTALDVDNMLLQEKNSRHIAGMGGGKSLMAKSDFWCIPITNISERHALQKVCDDNFGYARQSPELEVKIISRTVGQLSSSMKKEEEEVQEINAEIDASENYWGDLAQIHYDYLKLSQALNAPVRNEDEIAARRQAVTDLNSSLNTNEGRHFLDELAKIL